jgi:hypothetical protein
VPSFIVILGPPAVGKMTVGQEIAKKTKFKLFHNHLVIESLLPVFDFDSQSYKKLSFELRTRIFEEAIAANVEGLIFTLVLAYNREKGVKQFFDWIDLFKRNKFDIYVVELLAGLDIRLKRNETPNRLTHKSSKRDIKFSRDILLRNENEWEMQSKEGFFSAFPHLKIITDGLSAFEVSEIIIQHFKLASKVS